MSLDRGKQSIIVAFLKIYVVVLDQRWDFPDSCRGDTNHVVADIPRRMVAVDCCPLGNVCYIQFQRVVKWRYCVPLCPYVDIASDDNNCPVNISASRSINEWRCRGVCQHGDNRANHAKPVFKFPLRPTNVVPN